jgi:hypothetical protein
MILDTSSYLGPARIVTPATRPGFVQVALPDDDLLWARLALAVPYSPAEGDEVLVIFSDLADAYVIGVLRGTGTTTLRVPGDLALEAPHGSVRIRAGDGIQLTATRSLEASARRATFRFARLNVLATTLVERVGSLFTWVTGLIQSRSRRSRTIVEEGWLVRAGRGHVKTTDNIHIAGKTVHLG